MAPANELRKDAHNLNPAIKSKVKISFGFGPSSPSLGASVDSQSTENLEVPMVLQTLLASVCQLTRAGDSTVQRVRGRSDPFVVVHEKNG
jgi:hypothetical protein